MRIKRDTKAIKRLVDAVKTGLEFLPDSYYYEKKGGISWVWEECSDNEQEAVRDTRHKMNMAINSI